MSTTIAVSANDTKRYPRVLVVTSCTGEKRSSPKNQLTLEDFKNISRLQMREKQLAHSSCPAGQMYTGLQHLRAMEGVAILRKCLGRETVDVVILSAGYGLVPEDKLIVPYEVTFNAMRGYEVDEWANVLNVHHAFEKAIQGYDLVFMLLGEKYLRSLLLPVEMSPDQTFVILASQGSLKYLRKLAAKNLVFPLSNTEAKRYRYGSVGLKGFLFKRFAEAAAKQPELLQKVCQEPEIFKKVINKQPVQLELPLDIPKMPTQVAVKSPQRQLSDKTEFLSIPDHIPPAPNRHLGMQYFIPEWDDRVDPGFDFLQDTFTPHRNPYADKYAHQIYQSPNYDGILVSKVVIDKSKKKREYIEKAGGIKKIIGFEGKIMGDCGAFGYIKEKVPPYKTEEILEYYERMGFDYGVSIDHLIVGPFAEDAIVKKKRYELTLKNAEDFIVKHRAKKYNFIPIGAAQGWSPESYAKAVKKLIDMGYEYIALGGLARATSKNIIEILIAIQPHLTAKIQLHLFGVGRIDAIPVFRHLGVTSFDSSSSLRSAWLDPISNYHTCSGKTYAAIRIPSIEKGSSRVKRLLDAGVCDRETLKQLERNSLFSLRKFDEGQLSLEETLSELLAYDKFLELPRDGYVNPELATKRQKKHAQMYAELLTDKPWQKCDCVICDEIGIEVIIFRGNDRNRRRGFHNTYVFYKRFQEFLERE